MREIKFRAWTGSKMEYVMVGFLGAFYVQGMDEKDSASISPFNTKYHESTPVMQYTGLKDKNGKEIYEGDILREIQRMYEKNNIRLKGNSSVYFDSGMFKCNNLSLCTYSDTEVIGNIYENPELLTN